MKKRFKVSRAKSRRDFAKHGSKTHRRNISAPGHHANPMRGGIRL